MAAVTLVLLAAACCAPQARAAFVCEAQVDRTSVPAGDQLVLTATAEGDIGWSVDFALPDLPGVQVFNGGTNQSMSMVNGQTRTSVSRTWYLRPSREGRLEIGPVKVTARGETCRTAALAVTVTAAQAAPPADTGNRTQQPTVTDDAAGGDIFVTLDVDKAEAWLGEQIILRFRYWRRAQPWNNPSYNQPRTEGFWREDLGPERTLREVRGGRVYNVTEIRYALFATRAGDLVIEPAELVFPEDVFDRFFTSRRGPAGPRVLRTERVTVHVKALPSPAPAGFSGLVANRLALTATLSPDSTAAGEPVELKATLEADGFLKGFGGLEVRAPEGARMHDAAESLDTHLDGDRLVGRLAVEKVLVPDRDGELVVPPVSLSWFDASAGRYTTSSTPLRRIAVRPGRLPAGNADGSGFLRSEIARLGDDLAFIHTPSGRLRLAGPGLAGSPLWWMLLIAPLVLLGGWRLLLDRWAAARRDPAGRRRRRALGEAVRLLQGAADPADVARAVGGYVADSTDRPAASVDADTVRALAAARGRASVGDELARLLAACDAARFGGSGADAADLAARAGRLLQELDRDPPGPGPGREAAVVVAMAALLAAGSMAGAAFAQAADPARLLAEGNQAYTSGDLDQAVARYQDALAAGADDAVLLYNLGNAHARRGELGLAIAAYLRAGQLAPRDADIRRNLARVRGQIRDLELAGGELPLFIREFVDVSGRVSLDEWAAACLVLAWGLAGVVGWGWYRDGFSSRLRRAGLALAALLVVTGATTAWRWHDERGASRAVVVADEAQVRSGPAASFPVLFVVHDGLTVRMAGERDGWVRITLGGDWQGWLAADALVPVVPGPGGPLQGR
ncbi:MAG TPA: BatD family protein [Candidatus Krumholzibacteria bacterium]|nr:BatD family protein [Candidatus Krumholzibacteria bacterium]